MCSTDIAVRYLQHSSQFRKIVEGSLQLDVVVQLPSLSHRSQQLRSLFRFSLNRRLSLSASEGSVCSFLPYTTMTSLVEKWRILWSRTIFLDSFKEAAAMTEILKRQVCIIGSGPAAHTAAVYCARAELQPILFEGWMANGIAAGGQLTTTHWVENYPGFPEGIGGIELMDLFRKQSQKFGTDIITETVDNVDFHQRPFRITTSATTVEADAVIIATGAVARRLSFPGSDEEHGYWNKGISACAVCDGAAPIFRDKPLAVIGGGDSAVEEATFLTKYGSVVYIIHRRDALRASRILSNRALNHPKIKMLWSSVVTAAYGNDAGLIGSVRVKSTKTEDEMTLDVNGLFFAIGHDPATAIFKGQIDLDDDGYIITKSGSTATNSDGVFAAGDVQDKKYRQAVTAAGSGCMAALDVEHYLQEKDQLVGVTDSHVVKPTVL